MSETTETTAPDTVTLSIDGQQVTVPKGTNVLEAAKTLGTDISAFCYHPGLSIAACCRQCLVAIEKNPKLQPSCQTIAGDGMVVTTHDERSTVARKQMLEFTLVNHPIDCPICDKAGECTLQKLYFDHDNQASRVDVPKVRKRKVVDLGPHIVLDQERCIRVCDEVAGEHQLEMAHRGDHEELDTAPGAQLDNPYSLNTVDVCPVGALTSKDFRFTLRAWELMMTPSVCQGCATGCNTELHHKDGRAWRIVPRHNPDVNAYWMCDDGRFTYHDLRRDRLGGPVVGGLPSSWDRALETAARQLGAALAKDRESVGVVLSAQHENEANYVLAKLGLDIWQLENVYIGGKRAVPDRADDRLRDADVNPNTTGVKSILANRDQRGETAAVLEADLLSGDVTALIVLGNELDLSEDGLEAARNLETLIVIADREVGISKLATVVLPSAAWAETTGTVTNRDGRVQQRHAAFGPPGHSLPAWEIITKLAQACDAALSYPDTRSVFTEMVANVAAFKGATWRRDPRPVQLRWAHSRG
ncbi:MAG TPA: 2Fe-2S iron-sulfur cluster-binding protein [Kofleriaceae bacterium]|nr:2Fe-2S iron-sulfur cluster-binding protein [Kofleriaceae bacterium]